MHESERILTVAFMLRNLPTEESEGIDDWLKPYLQRLQKAHTQALLQNFINQQQAGKRRQTR